MKNGLTRINRNVLSEINRSGISSVIKPLTKEIQLFNCFVSETYDADEIVISNLCIGDEIITKKDNNNLFDEYAVAIFNNKGNKIGYIPEMYSSIVTKLINAGKVIKGKIVNIDRDIEEDIPVVEVDIVLVDY